jgi:hypothetical protein
MTVALCDWHCRVVQFNLMLAPDFSFDERLSPSAV